MRLVIRHRGGRTCSPAVCSGRSVRDQRVHVAAGEALAAAEERELDDEARARRTTPPSRSTRPQIASTVPPVASTSSWITTRAPLGIRSGMHLERVLAVLEEVARADRLRRQLAGPAGRHEAAAGGGRDRRAEDEPARLGADDRGRAPSACTQSASSAIVCFSAVGVGEQRRDVLEPDARASGSRRPRGSSCADRRALICCRPPSPRATGAASLAPARARSATEGRAGRRRGARRCGRAAPARRAARAARPRGRRPS